MKRLVWNNLETQILLAQLSNSQYEKWKKKNNKTANLTVHQRYKPHQVINYLGLQKIYSQQTHIIHLPIKKL